MTNPFDLLTLWLNEEKTLGAPNPQQAVLSTLGLEGHPHARVIAIRKISDEGFYFFTQRGTRKIAEIYQNPQVSLTFWLELQQRQIIIEGVAQALSNQENEAYWQSYPREAQIRFKAYASTSSQPILSKDILEAKKVELERQYENKDIPIDDHYLGFFIEAKRFIFYAYQPPGLSDVVEYSLNQGLWHSQCLSP